MIKTNRFGDFVVREVYERFLHIREIQDQARVGPVRVMKVVPPCVEV